VTACVEEAGQEEVVEDLPVKGQEDGGDGEVGSCTPLPSGSVLDSTFPQGFQILSAIG